MTTPLIPLTTEEACRIAEAEAMLAALRANYPRLLADDVARFAEAVADLEAAVWRTEVPAAERAAEVLHGIAHDIKGQAASFGHAGLGRVAARLCRLRRTRAPFDLLLVAARRLSARLARLVAAGAGGSPLTAAGRD